jgi:hypothetical protein
MIDPPASSRPVLPENINPIFCLKFGYGDDDPSIVCGSNPVQAGSKTHRYKSFRAMRLVQTPGTLPPTPLPG